MTTPQEPQPDTRTDDDTEAEADATRSTGAAGTTADEAPLDADEGDPQLDSYPG